MKTMMMGIAGTATMLAAGAPALAHDDLPPPPIAAPAANSRYVIHAGHLLARPGEPATTNKSIIVENGKIVAIRDGFVPAANVVDLSTSWVLPGLINLHTHIALPNYDQMVLWRLQRPEALVLKALPRMRAILDSGFTTVRDLGDDSSIMYELAAATEQGVVPGPRILASEQFFGIGNGYISDYNAGFKAELAPFYVGRGGNCTTREQCRNAVREEVTRGAQVIKIRLSYLPIRDNRIESVETVEELKWIIDMAHQLKRKVAVHTVVGASLAPVTNAILAGADTIEHGPLGPEQIQLMKQHHTAYIPTLTVAKDKVASYPGLSDRIRAGTAAAIKAGIEIGFGSDLPLVPVDQTYQEFVELNAMGLTPGQALQAATTTAAHILGLSDQIGAIAPGMAADIVAVDSDPLVDLRIMGRVGFVMKGGIVVKRAR